MFCTKCGVEQVDNRKFCRNCGNELKSLVDRPAMHVSKDVTASVRSKLNDGKSKKSIIKELVKKGWSEEPATQLVDSVERSIEEYKRSPEGRRELAGKYKRHMIFGLLWVAGGTIATVVTYSAASEGGTYFIFWGAIIFGAIDFLYGLFRWIHYSR